MNSARRFRWIAAGLLLAAILSPPTLASSETLGQLSARLGAPYNNTSLWGGYYGDYDIDGKVGYPLSLTGPRYHEGPRADLSIASGTLPPGLTMDAGGDISGVPTERGHWIVGLKIENIYLNGHHYTVQGMPDVVVDHEGWDTSGCKQYCYVQTVRFHITGTGEVH